ncbi:MAG: hypothetical protein EXS18_01455 [Verrucomicrobiae bacterium]|nr:hypothetical protein [Verrucomicrobiae bacterium]
MAWRIDESIVRGEIDNRQLGRVRGKVWLLGRPEPIELELRGNCHKDLAGCLLTFVNPSPRPGDHIDLQVEQRGMAGDMTASRKVRVPECSIKEMMRLSKAGLPFPEHMGNCLYVEWFSVRNGRVVIESVDFQIAVSERAWEMTDEQFRQQLESKAHAMGDWMQRIGEAVSRGKIEATEEDMNPPEEEDEKEHGDDGHEPYKPMDEFEWEKFLKESDARTDKHMKLIEKYGNSPEAEIQIAREMGWEGLADALEAKKDGESGPSVDDKSAFDDLPPLEPNPLTEGVDWVREDDGHPVHPLQKRIVDVTMSLWHHCKDRGLLDEDGDTDLHEMLFQAQMTGAKLAGALNGLGYEEDLRESGMIVALLKRALGYLNRSLAAGEKVAEKKLAEPDRLEAFRKNLFEIREEMLTLMERFRNER